MSRRWRTPSDWWRTRRQMRPAQLKEPGTCAACGTYLVGEIHHWHYVLRWVSGFREPAWLAVWLMIVADNTLHLAINYAAVKWL